MRVPLLDTPERRPKLRRLRLPRLRPLQCRAANAADRPVRIIGEEVKSLRDLCTGRRPVHFFQKSGVALAALTVAAVPASTLADPAPTAGPAVQAVQTAQPAGQTVADFYRLRNGYPLWLAANSGDAAQQLLTYLASANLDGLDPSRYHVEELRQLVDAAKGGKKKHVDEADRALSAA